MRKPSIFTQALTWFGVVLAIFAALLSASLWRFSMQAESEEWTLQTIQVIEKTDDVLIDLLSIETGERGFAVTGKESFLESLVAGTAALQKDFADLQLLTMDNPPQQLRLAALGDQIQEWGDTAIDPLVALRRQVNQGLAPEELVDKFISSEVDRRQMDAMRTTLASIKGEEESLLRKRQTALFEGNAWLRGMLLWGGAAAMAAGVLIALRTAKRLRKSNRALLDELSLRRQREAQLEPSEERLHLALDASHAGIWEWDIQTGENFWSEELWSLYGLEPHSRKPSYDSWLESIHPDYRTKAGQTVLEAASQGDDINMEWRVNTPSGEERWVLARGRPLRAADGRVARYLGIVLDITPQKRLEQSLRHAKEEWEQTFANVPDLIAIIDDQYRLVRVNQAMAERLGCTPEQCEGLACYQAVHGLDAPPSSCPYVKMLADDREHTEEVYEERFDGYFLVSVTPLRDEHGRITGSIHVARDITERKRAEEALERQAEDLESLVWERTKELHQAMEEAETANRAKSEFLASMSHEIRTPMNGIMGMIELANMSCKDTRPREYLGYAKKSAFNLLDIVNDILDLSKIEAGRVELEKSIFWPREMLENLFVTQGYQAEQKGLRFTAHVDQSVPERLMGDEGRLRQIFTNLVSNAVKYTRQGEVTVHVTAEPLEDEQIQGANKRPAPVCLIASIRDTGIGIAPDKLPRIFEPFTRGSQDAEFGGTGLGLTITKQLVEFMHGRIDVRSTLNQGSTFTVSVLLEAAPEEAVPTEPPGGGVAQGQIKPLKVLLAEDNEINRVMAVELLKLRGHEVVTVENGKLALEALAKEAFDLVLMDAQMPVMDGVETTRRIRAGEAGNPNVPITALTAYALKDDRERFLAAGMDDYLSKPIDLEELDRVLARVWSGEENV